jgi:UDP-glucose 4-epimerase
MKMVSRLAGKSTEIDKLCGSLQLDTGKAKALLHWVPPVNVEQGLEKTVAWYLKTKK